MGLYLLDYGAGNVRSLANSLKKLGYDFQWISSPDDFAKATVSLLHDLLRHDKRANFGRNWSFLASVLLRVPLTI